MTGFAISFRVNKKIPDAHLVCDDIIKVYSSKMLGYAVGEDSTYMEGEEPHYHVHLVTGEHNDNGTKITLSSITKMRERRWKFGQDCKLKVSEWDGDVSFLAYAVKEKRIRVNLPLTVQEEEFEKKVKECLANKMQKHEEFVKTQKLINAKKDLKTAVLEYIDKNLETVRHKVHSYSALNQQVSPFYLEEPALVKIALEKYQIENKKHFRQFEIDRFVCEYFRTKKDYLEMYFLRNSGQKVF